MFLVILCVLAAVVFILTLAYPVIKKRYNNFVLEHSVALKMLSQLNEKYNFYFSSKSYNESYTYDNFNFFTDISCEDYLIYQLQFKKYEIEKEIRLIKYNNINYQKYVKEIDDISFGVYDASVKGFIFNALVKLEKKAFRNIILNPVTEFYIKVSLYCSKINDEIYARKTEMFSSDEIEQLIKRLNNKNGSFYQDSEIWNSLCRVERGRVSNKMRFSIYERDGYRCRYCGRTEASDYLEIDHIKPIAKGGKSTYENLQTLCKRCNQMKSDKF